MAKVLLRVLEDVQIPSIGRFLCEFSLEIRNLEMSEFLLLLLSLFPLPLVVRVLERIDRFFALYFIGNAVSHADSSDREELLPGVKTDSSHVQDVAPIALPVFADRDC